MFENGPGTGRLGQDDSELEVEPESAYCETGRYGIRFCVIRLALLNGYTASTAYFVFNIIFLQQRSIVDCILGWTRNIICYEHLNKGSLYG